MIFVYLFIIFLKRVYIGDWESDCDWDWRKKKKKKNFKCPTGLWEIMCDDGESIASLRRDGEHHSATGGVPSAARVLNLKDTFTGG